MEQNEGFLSRLRKYLRQKSESTAFEEDPRLDDFDPAWLPGVCKLGICGEEAACLPGPNFTHKCVCPSDLSAPLTKKMLCPNRKTVPLTPRPILNITVGGEGITSRNHTNNNLGSNGDISLGVFLIWFWTLLLLCFVIVGIAYKLYRRSLLKYQARIGRRKSDLRALPPVDRTKRFSGISVSNPQYDPGICVQAPILSEHDLVFSEEIGRGFYGRVYRGRLKKEDGTSRAVAIKVLRDFAYQEAEDDFMREVEAMSSFQHENIVSLVGVVRTGNNSRPWMVFEFMVHGDLAEVLRRNSQQFWRPIPGLDPLTEESLLSIALQIAKGMKYLASQRFVHNDLACRNCLVGSGLVVKIADFGMSRDVYTSDYYRMAGCRPVPIRWMAPESIMYRKFTLESDVWSYGVVLWEIYTLGKQPYYGFSNEEVLNLIVDGTLLTPSGNCPPFICEIMAACWRREPMERVKFRRIFYFLEAVSQEICFDDEISVSKFSLEKFVFDDDSESPEASDNLGPFDAPEVSFQVAPDFPVRPRFPVPPDFPVPPVSEEELLDAEDYLAPRTSQMNEYLDPLPDKQEELDQPRKLDQPGEPCELDESDESYELDESDEYEYMI